MIFKRYGGSAKDILSMPFFDGYELIQFALDEEVEEKLYLRWVIGYQNVMGFDEFKRQIDHSREATLDNRSAEEILDSVREIIG